MLPACTATHYNIVELSHDSDFYFLCPLLSMSTVGQGASSDSSPQRFYTPSEIGSLYSSLPKSLPVQERAVASRAALRYKSHSDGLHLAVRHAGGLHPWYIAVHGNGKGSKEEQIEAINLLDGSLKDLFDAVSPLVIKLVCSAVKSLCRSQLRIESMEESLCCSEVLDMVHQDPSIMRIFLLMHTYHLVNLLKGVKTFRQLLRLWHRLSRKTS